MTMILQQLQDRFLNLLAERLPDDEKEKFLQCKKNIELYQCSKEELQESELFLMEKAKHFGFLILHGDLLSICVAESALRLRKSSHTVIEQLRFIKHLRLGDFHLNMAKVSQSGEW